MMEPEAVEVQVLAEDGKSHCLVMPTSPAVKDSKLLEYDDDSTARTENSTEIDDMSTLRDKFSYGSISFADGGTFSSFDDAGIARVRSKQGYLMSIDELNEAMKDDKSGECQDASLLDLDDDDDDSSDGVKTTHGNDRIDHSNFATAGNFIGDSTLQSDSRLSFYDGPSFASPTNTTAHALRNSESRAQFYGGYDRSNLASAGSVTGNTLDYSERRTEFYRRGNGRENVASTGSMFAEGITLNTDSRIGFYRVACSDTEAPLSCREKIVQPALSCDEDLWNTDQPYEEIRSMRATKQKDKNSSDDEDRGSSIFNAVTCCFMPSQP